MSKTINEPKVTNKETKRSYKGITIAIILLVIAIGVFGYFYFDYLHKREARLDNNAKFESCMDAAKSLRDDDGKDCSKDSLLCKFGGGSSSRKQAIKNCEKKYGD